MPQKNFDEYCRIHEGLHFTQNMNYHLNNSSLWFGNKNKHEIKGIC